MWMGGIYGRVCEVFINIAMVLWLFSDSEFVVGQYRTSSRKSFSVDMFVIGSVKLQ